MTSMTERGDLEREGGAGALAAAIHDAAPFLRALYERVRKAGPTLDPNGVDIIAAGTTVIPRFQVMLAPDRLNDLTADEFRSFLQFRNNQHWLSLQRLGPGITADMDRLREALRI